MIQLLIADDHEIFIEALVSLINTIDQLHVLATATNGQEALALVEQYPEAQLLILDVAMPVMDGIEATIELRRRKHTIPILMLTQEVSGGTITRALKAGVSGYVLKTAGKDELLRAITAVVNGSTYMSALASDAVINRVTGRKVPGELVTLTRRELEVLKQVANGRTTNEIAAALFISPHTAESHRRNLLQKLDLPNATALVRYAIEHGLSE